MPTASIYKGKDATAEVNTGLLAELRATERQAAEELGQWVTKSEPSAISTVGRPAASARGKIVSEGRPST
jgi:hypothetical protein